MSLKKEFRTIALVGGGPAALFMLKRLVEAGRSDYHIHIYERKSKIGAGMPYSAEGANKEHVTNVSDNEIPELCTSIEDWLSKAPPHLLHEFQITPENFNEFKVLPRLLFGEYLAAQFAMLRHNAREQGFQISIHTNTPVTDIVDDPELPGVRIITAKGENVYDQAVICTGHTWPKKYEDTIKGYFDSPYPPAKLEHNLNYAVAIRGSSLTAFDALRTLSRQNGHFEKIEKGRLKYHLNRESEGFKIVMHSIDGLLPAIRIHLDDSQLSKDTLMTEAELQEHRKNNNGFVSLDYLFDEKFKAPFKEKDPEFYDRIRNMNLEDFVDDMMSLRELLDPFTLFKAEYVEAEKSIKRLEPVHWKEMLAVLSFTINYPAKYFSAEDMLRLKKKLMPLISIVIAFVPQSSAQELIALHEAGVLSIVAVDRESKVEPGEVEGIIYKYKTEDGQEQSVRYKVFVDCIGQQPLSIHEIPFKGLLEHGTVSPARLLFKSPEAALKLMEEGNKDVEADKNGKYYLRVPGIMINDSFQVVDQYGAYNERIYIMAVPYISGINPDYSGLDFCEAASGRIINSLPVPEDVSGVS